MCVCVCVCVRARGGHLSLSLSHTHTHTQQAREAREAYADNILKAETNSCVASIAMDAADQAKHRCPVHSFTSRATSKVKKIIQQFVGVLDHSEGYSLFRRLPYVQKGANLTLTLLIELIRQGHLSKKSEMFIQWDGASENVAKTNLRFFVWFLLMCDAKGLPLRMITVCRSHMVCVCVCVVCMLVVYVCDKYVPITITPLPSPSLANPHIRLGSGISGRG